MFSQTDAYFHYVHDHEQRFRLRPGASKNHITVSLDKSKIVHNSLFILTNDSKQIIIPSSGFYEISGNFHFNLNTGNIKYNRAGINFGFIQIVSGKETFIASTRFSYKNENQEGFLNISVQPTIVYLEKDVIIAPVISSGFLDNVVLDAKLGCEKNTNNCKSFEWLIKKISDETFKQTYF